MRAAPVKVARLNISLSVCLLALATASPSTAHTVPWQEGKLTKSEPLDPNRATATKFPCFLFDNAVHTVETEDFIYKFFGSPIDFAFVADRNSFRFKIAKDGRVSVQNKKGKEQQTSLRVYAKTTKISQPLGSLPPKAKHRDWLVANIRRMQPVLFSFDMPWLLTIPEPPCPLRVSIIGGWVFELDAHPMTYEVVQKGSEPPLMPVSDSVWIAEKGKDEAYIIDEAGKQRKLRTVKKTIQNPPKP